MAGELDLTFETLHPADDPDQALFVHTADPRLPDSRGSAPLRELDRGTHSSGYPGSSANTTLGTRHGEAGQRQPGQTSRPTTRPHPGESRPGAGRDPRRHRRDNHTYRPAPSGAT